MGNALCYSNRFLTWLLQRALFRRQETHPPMGRTSKTNQSCVVFNDAKAPWRKPAILWLHGQGFFLYSASLRVGVANPKLNRAERILAHVVEQVCRSSSEDIQSCASAYKLMSGLLVKEHPAINNGAIPKQLVKSEWLDWGIQAA